MASDLLRDLAAARTELAGVKGQIEVLEGRKHTLEVHIRALTSAYGALVREQSLATARRDSETMTPSTPRPRKRALPDPDVASSTSSSGSSDSDESEPGPVSAATSPPHDGAPDAKPAPIVAASGPALASGVASGSSAMPADPKPDDGDVAAPAEPKRRVRASGSAAASVPGRKVRLQYPDDACRVCYRAELGLSPIRGYQHLPTCPEFCCRGGNRRV